MFGGCFDAEFKNESEAFFREVGAGKFLLPIADATIRELALAPEKVRKVLASLDTGSVELISLSEAIRVHFPDPSFRTAWGSSPLWIKRYASS